MHKLAIIGAGTLMALLVVAFLCVAAIDIPVKQSEIVKTIPNERFFKAN